MEGYATLFTVMRLSVRYYLSIDDYNRNYISGDHERRGAYLPDLHRIKQQESRFRTVIQPAENFHFSNEWNS